MSPAHQKPIVKLPRNVIRQKARGRYYYYHQIGRGTALVGKRTRIEAEPHEPEFWEICAKLNGEAPPAPRCNTFETLIVEYKASPDYTQLRPKTRKEYDRCMDIIATAWSGKLVAGVRPKHVLKFRDKFAKTPTTANHIVTTLSIIIKWGIPREFAESNPCDAVKKLKTGPGYAPWPWELIELAKQHMTPHIWQVTVLALYTGQRQGDVLAMKWSDIKNGEVHVKQQKTSKSVWIPIHRDLQQELDKIERRSIFILTNSKGIPWKSGFYASFQKQTARTELAIIREKGLVFHGLRKCAVVTMLEANCTSAHVASITGQSMQMVEHYAKQVCQRKLAREAILKWEESGR